MTMNEQLSGADGVAATHPHADRLVPAGILAALRVTHAAVRSATDERSLLQDVCHAVVKAGACRSAAVSHADAECRTLQRVAASMPLVDDVDAGIPALDALP